MAPEEVVMFMIAAFVAGSAVAAIAFATLDLARFID
jgi:archaellum component FlaG (FlaF/FlaG flagellin family)